MNRNVTLVLGGARSGKSRFALSLGEALPGPRMYLATAEPGDPEMRERIARHRRERAGRWETVEEPLALAERLASLIPEYPVILVDCLTLWLSNLLGQGEEGAGIRARVDRLLAVLDTAKDTVILVSNEVGWGIVPETPLGRAFRDLQGLLNQRMAQAADRVYLVAAGIPLCLKRDGQPLKQEEGI